MSKVSIVVPIYNPGKKLIKCIKSIISQTFEDIEIILVNDGSTDDSLKICEKYKERDKRVVVIDKENEGSIATRRVGVEAATSDYVMFVDSDDWVERNAVKDLYEETIKSDSDITVCKIVKVIGNQKFIKREYNSKYFAKDKIFNEKEIKTQLVTAYFHGHPFPSSLCAKLYKKELLINSGKWLEQIKFLGEDLFYNLEIFLKAQKVKVINKSLYYYRVGGFSSKYMPHFFDDMINGYNIQKDVINEYYLESIQSQLNGISIMLLNTFKTSLINLFYSNLTYTEKMEMISFYISSKEIKEALNNHGAKRYFPTEYLEAIENQRVDYLFSLGEAMYKKARPKKLLVGVLSNLI
jgi:glycosyltransferase involved in cell wall biosynthesis